MKDPFQIAVLISGSGSNMLQLIENAWHYTVKLVISNNPEAGGLVLAQQAGIETKALSRADYPSLAEFKSAIFESTLEAGADLVCLAGFMMLVPEQYTKIFTGQMINIHPSLLPKFPGLDTHKRVIEGGEREHGCTVHFVDAGVDTGPIIAQAKLKVRPDSQADDLSREVLALEHKLYPWVVNSIARGWIRPTNGQVQIEPQAKLDAAAKGFIIPR
ncbi:MAG: phosphoribosylglycinamide formyltransferase [Deltaproteobacteria bacterium]|nr:phosphoribosylglycinamide formyltransferase [Deltaproteobacteria bacterium]